ncbi:HaaA family cyclophane-containing RiPP peptide [Streptomyces sp. NPDC059092]|uniref:HaaA family cyclophane-containing RiPP peptide n=1 Tax=Streptomyces sp. NPDC059092 TaxID=3346725 RepID=UPI0036A31932
MPSRTSDPAPQAPAGTGEESEQDMVVLERVAARVRQRQTAERTAANRVGDGAHAASLIWPWPL